MLSKKKPQDRVDPEYLVGLDTASAQPAPAGVKSFIKKHWKPITAAVCAAAVAAAVLVPKNSAKPAAASAEPTPAVKDVLPVPPFPDTMAMHCPSNWGHLLKTKGI